MTLYLVATPIGNLADFSFRAVELLRQVDYILCEDTRHSLKLLQHYSIQKPLRSYHQFNEAASLEGILADLRAGQQVALISDAGTPGICDPGERLVRACVQAELEVSAVPGACAAVLALTLSGFPTERFQFLGFPPRTQSALRAVLERVLYYPGVTIFYEAPTRLAQLLTVMAELVPQRQVAVARELTKKFEEVRRGTAAELAAHWTEHEPRGECVVLLAPGSGQQSAAPELSLAEQVVQFEEEFGLSRSDAIRAVADERGLPKRDVYNAVHGSRGPR